MASVSTHIPFKPGQWAMDQIRTWQLERAAGFKAALNVMERVGAVGVLCSDRVHGFWWDTEKPPQKRWWKPLAVPNSHNRVGQYRSTIGKEGRALWTPTERVVHLGQKRDSPLYREVNDIKIKDWWHLAVSLGVRPLFWPAFGLFLMPEVEILGDYGEHVVLWVPVDRFGFNQEPMDCTQLTALDIQKIYSTAWRDIKRAPVIESYVGDEIKFRFEGDFRDAKPDE